MTVLYAIYAFENLDGICAGAILTRWMRLKGYKHRISFLNFKNQDDTFKDMCKLARSLIFIVDFPPEQIEKFEDKLKLIGSRHNRIMYWNSHLDIGEEEIVLIKGQSSFFDNQPDLSAAEMVCKRFLPMDSIANELKDIAHDWEFFKQSNDKSQKLSDLISSGYNLRELVDELAMGVFWSDKFEKLHQVYLKKKEKAFKSLIKGIKIHYHSPYNFGYAFCSTLLSPVDAGQKLLEDPKLDVSVVIYRDGRLGFRRREDVSVNLSSLSKLFNGGGHVFAAGGRFTDVMMPIGSGNRFNISVDKMDKILREYFKNLKEEKQTVLSDVNVQEFSIIPGNKGDIVNENENDEVGQRDYDGQLQSSDLTKISVNLNKNSDIDSVTGEINSEEINSEEINGEA